MTYEELWHRLTAVCEAGEAKAIARMVLDVRFGLSLTDIISGKDTELSANDQTELEKIAQRLCEGEPVQYVLGVADFCGRQFRVAPGVLIPRPETEELCRWILEERGAWKEEREYSLLDIGTGSGCIAITLAAELPQARVAAWDISDDALRIAADNARRLQVSVAFERHDILSPTPSPLTPHLSIVVSNPPYILPSERQAMEKNVLDHEPAVALFVPKDDPIIYYRSIADYAMRSLKPGGQLYFELNTLTASSVGDYVLQAGFAQAEFHQDQFGRRCEI